MQFRSHHIIRAALALGVMTHLLGCSKFPKKKSEDTPVSTANDAVAFPNPAQNTVNLTESVTAAQVESYLASLEKYINEQKRPDAVSSQDFDVWLANAPALTGLASDGSFEEPNLDRGSATLALAETPTTTTAPADANSSPATSTATSTTTDTVTEPPPPPAPAIDPTVRQIVNQAGPGPAIVLPRPPLNGNGLRGRIQCNQYTVWGQCCNPLNGRGAFTDNCVLKTSTGMRCRADRVNNFRIFCPRPPGFRERITGWSCPPRDPNACPL